MKKGSGRSSSQSYHSSCEAERHCSPGCLRLPELAWSPAGSQVEDIVDDWHTTQINRFQTGEDKQLTIELNDAIRIVEVVHRGYD